jgi:small subunit ribosomal protein S1
VGRRDRKVQKGTIIEGYVKSITDFGVFVEIEEGVEGLIHLSEIEIRNKQLSECSTSMKR